jgi:threonine/homoserine/homoserine lactone efflux protein
MGSVIGIVVPLAVGVAITPVPIIAVILMLFAPRAGRTSSSFLIGWIVGIAVLITVVGLIAATTDLGSNRQPSTGSSWLKIVLGLGLLVLAGREWRDRPKPGQEPHLPKWLSAIGSVTPKRALMFGLLLSAANPKNLILALAAGAAIAAGDLDTAEAVAAGAIFTAVASSSIALPVIAYAMAPRRVGTVLRRLETWLEAHNAEVMAAILILIGAALIGQGISGLTR